MWTHKMQNEAITTTVKGARNMFRSWKRGVKCKMHETWVVFTQHVCVCVCVGERKPY